MSSKVSPSKKKADSTGQPPRKEIDSALVKAHLAGEPSAFKALSDRYRDPLMFHVRKIARDEGSLEDLIQEIFTKAFENLDKYNHEYAFSTWLYRIATNHTIDSLRKRKILRGILFLEFTDQLLEPFFPATIQNQVTSICSEQKG